MPSRITQLKLVGFRGASQPLTVGFDHDKTVVMIFGENGTGKSTLIDAIDAVSNASLGSIMERGAGGNAHKYLPSLSATQQLEVELATKSGHSWRATLSGRKYVVQPVDGHAEPPPVVRVLRRSKLLQLLEDAPADRYAAMKHFLDVAGVEASEAALWASYAPLHSDWEREEAARSRDLLLLEEEWQRERLTHETATTARDWATTRLSENIDALREEAARLDALQLLLAGIKEDKTTAISLGLEWRTALANLEAAQTKLATAPDAAAHPASLLAVLRDALHYLRLPGAEPGSTTCLCPVCAVPADQTRLQAQLVGRLERLQITADLVDVETAAAQTLELADDRLRQAGAALAAKLGEMAGLLASQTPVALASCTADWDTYQEAANSAVEPHQRVMAGCRLATRLQDCCVALDAEAQALIGRVQLFDSLKSRIANFDEINRKLLETDAIRDRLKRTIDLVVERRKRFTQRILDSITAEVNRLYTCIHPNENIGLDRLEMDPNRRGSLSQRVNFGGHAADVPPQAYLSESHLDTLGFCLWLALAKRSGAEKAVIVLDDVFTSVDLEHFQRITDLLDAEAPNFGQLIIATHSRRWYDRYQRRRDNVHLMRLERWSLTKGVRVFSEKTFVTELEAALAQVPLNRRDVATQAGILLEELLQVVASAYECSLPLKEVPKFLLHELVSGTTKVMKVAKVKRLLPMLAGATALDTNDPAAWESIDIKPLFEALSRRNTEPRNAAAHYSVSGLDLADEEMEAFATEALALARALTCPVCCELPQKIVDGSYRGCACPKPRKMQLSPVLRP